MVQHVEGPDLQLYLAARHLFHVVVYFLDDLEHRVTGGKNPNGFSSEHACRPAGKHPNGRY